MPVLIPVAHAPPTGNADLILHHWNEMIALFGASTRVLYCEVVCSIQAKIHSLEPCFKSATLLVFVLLFTLRWLMRISAMVATFWFGDSIPTLWNVFGGFSALASTKKRVLSSISHCLQKVRFQSSLSRHHPRPKQILFVCSSASLLLCCYLQLSCASVKPVPVVSRIIARGHRLQQYSIMEQSTGMGLCKSSTGMHHQNLCPYRGTRYLTDPVPGKPEIQVLQGDVTAPDVFCISSTCTYDSAERRRQVYLGQMRYSCSLQSQCRKNGYQRRIVAFSDTFSLQGNPACYIFSIAASNRMLLRRSAKRHNRPTRSTNAPLPPQPAAAAGWHGSFICRSFRHVLNSVLKHAFSSFDAACLTSIFNAYQELQAQVHHFHIQPSSISQSCIMLLYGLLVLLACCICFQTRLLYKLKLLSKCSQRKMDFQLFKSAKIVLQPHYVLSRLPLLLCVTLLPSTTIAQPPPVTTGLIAYYNADSWNGTAWTDLSGSGKHVTEVGGSGIAVARPAGAPAYVYGPSTAWMKFPEGILPSKAYTLFFVARYNGADRGRILQGLSTNWLSGFGGNSAGRAFHGISDPCTQTINTVNHGITLNEDLHGSDWVLGSDRSNSFRSNGVDRTIPNSCQVFDRLAINTNSYKDGSGSPLLDRYDSDFAIQSILVYNVMLSDQEVQRVEAWLASIQLTAVPFQPPPLATNLIAHYNADSWNGTRWEDLSGYGNHVKEIGAVGSIAVARPAGAPAYVYGPKTVWMKFPKGILPSAAYTLFFVARYNGADRGRILQGFDKNWLSGFHDGDAGVANHCASWMTNSAEDVHGSDWVLGSDLNDRFRSNGVDRTTNVQSNTCFARLAINTNDGLPFGNQASDFAIQSILVYNVRLSDADVQRVEAWLASFQPVFTPGNLQASGLNEVF
jgi:hypothetical protein